MKYGIIANPISGKLDPNKKRISLNQVSRILRDCVVAGLDTKSREEFGNCARELSQKVDVLIAAGGDGTFSDVLNSVDSSVTLSYLPFGSGNMLKYSLNFPRNIKRVAEQIRDGNEHELDLIACQGRKALTTSVGLEGHILAEREKNLSRGIDGFKSYAKATVKSIFGGYERTNARVNVDGKSFGFPGLLSLIITKAPYYGYGMKVVPRAKMNDGLLHILAITSSNLELAYGILTSFISKNQIGNYELGRNIKVEIDKELYLHTDGNLCGKNKTFEFQILPKRLRMRY